MRVCLLASGSKGNAIYIESAETRILVDAGLSARETAARLAGIGVDPERLDALLITHEHGDHCRGLGPMARRYNLPVYLTPGTRQALPNPGRIEGFSEFEAGDAIELRDLLIQTFPLTHDAAAPAGFSIDTCEGRISIATDLGIATRLVAERLKQSRVLILESNHDETMLRDGPYPWPLKQRVRSNHGHLSNAASSELLQGLLWEGLEAVFLAHLSEVNNLPKLAEQCARQVLDRQNACAPTLILGAQHQASACFEQ
ncbi:MBL fold metallo-hydrolase [Desulfuromonas versatilis]|uniref:MBL fold metallo-hydrolase n=1 Tax=Desulfuromonas versatilis TaxID=2802975 RepID=A0ABN6DXJ7_9BACT|nr:MBL fold metallo-hydrolase [Desulfuromonas versatilis]BCR04863.1 MBL fold metallo-hydrolase [Desulfuromonas versatilis]